jgi:2-polyprenyl-3-methyl-5-hydroxy-6-metoxy-1,4-benzoquinol methylase
MIANPLVAVTIDPATCATEVVSVRCNACGSELINSKPTASFMINRKGKQVIAQWFSCSACGSCFCGIDSSEQDDIVHHQTREHGRIARFERCRQLKQTFYEYICRGMKQRGLSGSHILDVGASFGGFMEVARNAGFKTSAVDINPDCVEYLRGNGFEAFQASSLANLTAEEFAFNAISMLDVSYYFKDQRREFQRARALLKPDGWLVVRTTNKRWLISMAISLAKIRRKWAQRLFSRAVVDHAFVQSVNSLKVVLQDCGYREIFIEPDKTHLIPDAGWDAKVTYALGIFLSKIARRPVLVPGIIVWAQR